MSEEESMCAENVEMFKKYIEGAMADPLFQDVFKEGVADNTKKLVALQIGIRRTLRETLGPLVGIFGPSIEVGLMHSYVNASGNHSVAEVNEFLKSDACEYVAMKHMIGKCKECQKIDTCKAYEDYVSSEENSKNI